jgi:hypothetical protein
MSATITEARNQLATIATNSVIDSPQGGPIASRFP